MRLSRLCRQGCSCCRGVHADCGIFLPRLGDSLNDTFKEWNPVLQKVAESHPAFLRHLTEDLVNDLAFKNTTDISADASSEALYLWLAHILTSSAWEFHRQSCPQSYVLRACDESPHHWTKMLGDQLRKHASRPKSALAARPAAKNRVSKPKHVRNDSQYAPTQLSDKLLEHGWGFLEKWDSRPLGVVSSN